MKKRVFLSIVIGLFSIGLVAQPCWQKVDSVVGAYISSGVAPGAVLCVVHDNQIVHLRAFGNRQVYPKVYPMKVNTIFDLASLSKTTGTAMAVMRLIDEGRLSVEDKVTKYIPDFNDTIIVADLLTHTSGLPAYANATMLEEKYGSPQPDSLMMHISMLSHGREQGSFNYSCLNFITLQNIVQVITGMSLQDYYAQYIAAPLGLTHTTYCPPEAWKSQIAPTENIKVDRKKRRLLHGEVHDPLARIMNAGNSGNAGLFSNAEDLAKICIFLLNPDSVGGPFSAETVRLMTTIPEGYESAGRTLGWDSQSDYNAPVGHYFAENSYCHSGYTGTSLAIDPERRIAVILLANRVHPKDKGNMNPLRRAVADEVAMLYPLPLEITTESKTFDRQVKRTIPAIPSSMPAYYGIEPVRKNIDYFPNRKVYFYIKKHKKG